MRNLVRTLRFRFVLMSLMVFGFIQIGRSIWLYWMATEFFLERFDTRLLAESNVIRDALDALDRRGIELGAFDGLFVQLLRPIDGAVLFRNLDGRVLVSSDAIGVSEVPFDEPARKTRWTGQPNLQTLTADSARSFEDGDRLRIATTFRDATGDRGDTYIQVCMSLRRTDEGLETVRNELIYVTSGTLLVVACASYMLVRRALAPIGQIAREARDLTAARLDRRLAMPAGRDEVADMIETLNGMLARLESAFRSQERFIANAAHELRTPVTHLLGRAQLLIRQQASEPQLREFVLSVQDEMRSLSRLNESLLVLARVDAGLPLGSRAILSANEVLMDAVERCTPLAVEGDVKLVPTLYSPVADQPEPTIDGDAELLITMISNLIRNAIRFSPPGAAVEIAIGATPTEVEIRVSDRGPGIPEDKLALIFERFVQLPQQREEHKGAGLGLAIARSVAETHGGSIACVNRAGGGTEFQITLPCAPLA